MSNQSGPKLLPFPVAPISSLNYDFSSPPQRRSSRLEKKLGFSVISSLFLSSTHAWDQQRRKQKNGILWTMLRSKKLIKSVLLRGKKNKLHSMLFHTTVKAFFLLIGALNETKDGRTAEGDVIRTLKKNRKELVWKQHTTVFSIRKLQLNMTVFKRQKFKHRKKTCITYQSA